MPGLKIAFSMRLPKFFFKVLLLSICLCTSQINQAHSTVPQWNNIGPEGGDILALAINPLHPSILYAVTKYNGVFKTTDGGFHWNFTGLSNKPINALAIDPQNPLTLYVGGYCSDLYKSTDGGTSWNTTGLTGSCIYSLAVDPQTPDNVYAGGLYSISKSIDGGVSWTSIYLAEDHVNTLVIDPLNPNTLYAGTWGGVYKSTDGSTTWEVMNTGLTNRWVNTLALDPVNRIIYAGTRGGVFKSNDGAATWSAVNTGLTKTYVNTMVINPLNPNILYVGTCFGEFAGTWLGVFKSADGGANWSAMSSGLTGTKVLALAIDPLNPNTVYAGTECSSGVYKSTDAGTTWNIASTGLTSTRVFTLAIDPLNPSNLYVGICSGGFKSTDGGSHWDAILKTPIRSITTIAIDPLHPNILYAGSGEWGGVFKSTDSGAYWNFISLQGIAVPELIIDPINPSILYGIGEPVVDVIKSTDGGATWNRTNLATNMLYAIVVAPQTPSILYAGTWHGVFKSTDGGAIWNLAGLNDEDVYALTIDSRYPSTLYAGTGSGVYKSTDGGANWNTTNKPDTHVNKLAIDSLNPNVLYAGTRGGVYKSIDGGATWSIMNTGLTNTNVLSLVIDPKVPGTLYAGTDGGGAFKIQGVTETITAPSVPSGSTAGNIGTSYTYSTEGSSSSLDHLVEYQFDWKGDGSVLSPWGSSTQSTIWQVAGNYGVRARARCKTDTSVVSDWSGTLSVNIISNPTLTVLKSGTGIGIVTSSPAGINCGDDCSEVYAPNTKVTLTAKADTNSSFTGWSGGGCSGTGKCIVTMNTDTSVTATFSAKTPDISVAQTTLDFGSVKPGKKVTKTLKITNKGSGDLVITFSGLEGTDFCIQGSSSITIKTKKSYSLKVLCTPTSGSLKTAILGIQSNDPDTPTLEISLAATLPETLPDISVAQASLDFGSVKLGKKVTKTLKISNSGSGDLVITLSGLEETDFSIQGSSSVTIKAKKSYSLKVLFMPTSGGLKTATLRITSNDPDTPISDIPLSGTGQ